MAGDFLEYVLGQLGDLRGLTYRRMFGGVGLYADGVCFGLLMQDVLYFKVGDANRADYESRGMPPFRPNANKATRGSTSYFEVPADVLEDADECTAWARRSAAAAASRARLPAR
jgi:DNA transformation protein